MIWDFLAGVVVGVLAGGAWTLIKAWRLARRAWRKQAEYAARGGRVPSTGPAGPDHRPRREYRTQAEQAAGFAPVVERPARPLAPPAAPPPPSGDVSYIGGPHRRGPGRPPPQEPIPGRIDWDEIEDLIRELKAAEPPHVPRPPGWGERLGTGWNPPMRGRDRP